MDRNWDEVEAVADEGDSEEDVSGGDVAPESSLS